MTPTKGSSTWDVTIGTENKGSRGLYGIKGKEASGKKLKGDLKDQIEHKKVI